MPAILRFLVRWQLPTAVVLAAVALVSVPGAVAGGSFERIVGVGANGAWAEIKLNQTGPHSDAALDGPTVPVPSGGYIRIYPFIGGLPAIPGRFYPATHVLCLYWHEPASNCSSLAAAGTELLAPLARLPRRRQPPTTPIAVHFRSRLLRYADGNIFAAIELALERRPQVRASMPRNTIALTVRWRGPDAASRPQRLLLSPIGVYVSTRLFPLERGPWCYLAGNLPDPSASLLESLSRICR